MAKGQKTGKPKDTKTGEPQNKRTKKPENPKKTGKNQKEAARKFHGKRREELVSLKNFSKQKIWLAVLAGLAAGIMILTTANWWQNKADNGQPMVVNLEKWKLANGNFSLASPTPAIPTPALLPLVATSSAGLDLTAQSYLVMDVRSAVVLAEKESKKPWPPASITKVMTALVAWDHYLPEEEVTVGNLNVEGQKMELVPGEKITVESLLYGMLVQSGNDAAEVLASHFPGGRAKFIEEMNKKARKLNLVDTRFANPSGVDDKYHFSTARDLARLAVVALRNKQFAKMIATKETVVEGRLEGEEEPIIHRLANTNELLTRVKGVKGVKTGWTEESGESLIALTERQGKGILTVVLGSEDRFGETERLIEWVYANTRWTKADLLLENSGDQAQGPE